jgi:hypothetical protein
MGRRSMTTFVDDFAWQARFKDEFARIIRNVVRVDVASWDDDLHRATDFLVAYTPAGRVGARARRHDYKRRYRYQFTIRLSRPSGARTELRKLELGFGDFGVYGFESEPGADRLYPWVLYNVALLREHLNGGGRWYYGRNLDGSSDFAAFDVRDLPLGCLLNSEGIQTEWPPPVGACGVCGRPSYLADEAGRPMHRCCGFLPEGATACPACDESDRLQHVRYGWPRS